MLDAATLKTMKISRFERVGCTLCRPRAARPFCRPGFGGLGGSLTRTRLRRRLAEPRGVRGSDADFSPYPVTLA